MIEKRGDINESTPPEHGCRKGKCQPKSVNTKEAADQQEEHLTTRLAEAAEEASKQSK